MSKVSQYDVIGISFLSSFALYVRINLVIYDRLAIVVTIVVLMNEESFVAFIAYEFSLLMLLCQLL